MDEDEQTLLSCLNLILSLADELQKYNIHGVRNNTLHYQEAEVALVSVQVVRNYCNQLEHAINSGLSKGKARSTSTGAPPPSSSIVSEEYLDGALNAYTDIGPSRTTSGSTSTPSETIAPTANVLVPRQLLTSTSSPAEVDATTNGTYDDGVYNAQPVFPSTVPTTTLPDVTKTSTDNAQSTDTNPPITRSSSASTHVALPRSSSIRYKAGLLGRSHTTDGAFSGAPKAPPPSAPLPPLPSVTPTRHGRLNTSPEAGGSTSIASYDKLTPANFDPAQIYTALEEYRPGGSGGDGSGSSGIARGENPVGSTDSNATISQAGDYVSLKAGDKVKVEIIMEDGITAVGTNLNTGVNGFMLVSSIGLAKEDLQPLSPKSPSSPSFPSDSASGESSSASASWSSDPQPGRFIAITPYEAANDIEVSLAVADQVEIMWWEDQTMAYGFKASTKEEGLFYAAHLKPLPSKVPWQQQQQKDVLAKVADEFLGSSSPANAQTPAPSAPPLLPSPFAYPRKSSITAATTSFSAKPYPGEEDIVAAHPVSPVEAQLPPQRTASKLTRFPTENGASASPAAFAAGIPRTATTINTSTSMPTIATSAAASVVQAQLGSFDRDSILATIAAFQQDNAAAYKIYMDSISQLKAAGKEIPISMNLDLMRRYTQNIEAATMASLDFDRMEQEEALRRSAEMYELLSPYLNSSQQPALTPPRVQTTKQPSSPTSSQQEQQQQSMSSPPPLSPPSMPSSPHRRSPSVPVRPARHDSMRRINVSRQSQQVPPLPTGPKSASTSSLPLSPTSSSGSGSLSPRERDKSMSPKSPPPALPLPIPPSKTASTGGKQQEQQPPPQQPPPQQQQQVVAPQSTPTVDAAEVERRRAMAREVIRELVATEEKYMKDLKLLIDHVMTPLPRERVGNDPLVRPLDMERMFKGIPKLYNLSSKVNNQLKVAERKFEEEGDTFAIGNVFLDHVEDWNVYIKYVENYSTARETMRKYLERFDAKGEAFRKFFERVQRRKEFERKDIGHFMLLPIQRISKYWLILQRLQKYSDNNNPLIEVIDAAEQYMFQIGTVLDHAKKREDEMHRMFEIVREVDNCPHDIISFTRRRFIDDFEVEGPKNKRMKVFLFSDCFLIATPRKGGAQKDGKKYDLVRRVNLRQASVSSANDGTSTAGGGSAVGGDNNNTSGNIASMALSTFLQSMDGGGGEVTVKLTVTDGGGPISPPPEPQHSSSSFKPIRKLFTTTSSSSSSSNATTSNTDSTSTGTTSSSSGGSEDSISVGSGSGGNEKDGGEAQVMIFTFRDPRTRNEFVKCFTRAQIALGKTHSNRRVG
ncbi:Protein T2 [Quaeritorhiza haematococci]|nr:Protein T2 [Quaeritorhiza haematococci]